MFISVSNHFFSLRFYKFLKYLIKFNLTCCTLLCIINCLTHRGMFCFWPLEALLTIHWFLSCRSGWPTETYPGHSGIRVVRCRKQSKINLFYYIPVWLGGFWFWRLPTSVDIISQPEFGVVGFKTHTSTKPDITYFTLLFGLSVLSPLQNMCDSKLRKIEFALFIYIYLELSDLFY
jgi:hypothetical protein